MGNEAYADNEAATMTTTKELLEKSLDALAEKAEDCSDLAKAQRVNADKQHAGAHKLESLGHALEVDVAAIRRELDSVPNPPESSQSSQPPKAD